MSISQQPFISPEGDTPHHPPDGVQHTEAAHAGEAASATAERAGGRIAKNASLVGVAAVVLTGGYWIGKDIVSAWTGGTRHVEPEKTAVPVKVTQAGQPVGTGFLIRPLNGPSFPLDANGETTVDSQYRGARYEIKDSTGKVVYSGIIAATGRLDIELA